MVGAGGPRKHARTPAPWSCGELGRWAGGLGGWLTESAGAGLNGWLAALEGGALCPVVDPERGAGASPGG